MRLKRTLLGGDGDTNKIEMGDSGAAARNKTHLIVVVVVVVVVAAAVAVVATIRVRLKSLESS